MAAQSAVESQVYRVGTHLLAVVGFFALLFGALGVSVVVKRGDWTVLLIALGAAAVLLIALQVLRLEVGPGGFRYRNLSGSREVAFADVGRAYFEVVRATNAPQGVAAFWVERRGGGRVKVNLRTFPVRAAATLFTALEAHGIAVEVPDDRAARRMADQVRAEQVKMRGPE